MNSVVQQTNVFVVNQFLLALTNALAYFIAGLIMAVKSFMIQVPGALFWKLFFFITYKWVQ